MWRRALLAAVFVGLAIGPAIAEAQVTKSFCISGTSDGRPWTWSLSGEGGLPSQTVTAPAVPDGGTATDLARGWVRSIQAVQGRPPAYRAQFVRTAGDGKAYFSITAASDFSFGVDDCEITGNPDGCRFNPEVVEVDEVPRDGPPPAARTIIIIIVIVVAIIIIVIVIILRRR